MVLAVCGDYRGKHVVATQSPGLDERDPLLHICPSCGDCVSDTLDHVVLGCEKYTLARQSFISYELQHVLDFMAEHGVEHTRENVWHCVLGGFPPGPEDSRWSRRFSIVLQISVEDRLESRHHVSECAARAF